MNLSVKVGNLFDSYRSTIITIYNGAYDSSAAIFLFIKVKHLWCNLRFLKKIQVIESTA